MFGVTLDIRPEWWPAQSADYDLGECLAYLAECQARVNLLWLKRHPGARLMYETGIRYKFEPAQPITMKGIPTIVANGGSDCKNLVAWRLAELWRDELLLPPIGYGRQMSSLKTYWKSYSPTSRIFHAEIRLPTLLPNGKPNPETVEDPSRFLGMV